MEGIDIYTRYQTVTSWAKVRSAGKEFVWIKCSDGTHAKDTSNWPSAAKAAGLKVGFYHYAQPGDPVAQANLLVDLAEQRGATDLAPVLDLETPFVPNGTAVSFAQAFLTQLARRGHVPCIYGNQSMLSYVLPRLSVPNLKVWAARYGAKPFVGFDVHQYSQTGSVPGISGSVDLNRGNPPLNRVGSTPAAPPAATPLVVLET